MHSFHVTVMAEIGSTHSSPWLHSLKIIPTQTGEVVQQVNAIVVKHVSQRNHMVEGKNGPLGKMSHLKGILESQCCSQVLQIIPEIFDSGSAWWRASLTNTVASAHTEKQTLTSCSRV
ncbi:uncharacterized protein LOC143444058 [Arvicanthis niloticus]|uniref:uncharacterized protein LOC143314326 n=1 Tax=Arvicanthis niloticus TaxID=61156 RepID=UPI00402B89B4